MFEITERHARLRDILSDRRLELQHDLRRRVRIGRIDQPARVGDEVDGSDAARADEVELAMLQTEDDTLRRIDEALVRLDVQRVWDVLHVRHRDSGSTNSSAAVRRPVQDV